MKKKFRMLNELALAGLRFYKLYIDDKKGFKCAYKAVYRGDSCSTIMMQALEEQPIIPAVRSCFAQLERCNCAEMVAKDDDRFLQKNGKTFLVAGGSVMLLAGCGCTPDPCILGETCK
ncbi:membrane protein insertion efficiency factor YidD [Fertoebacter nigrum]|uniref:Membrane protein insertion efficiency factor YidD n=1 Tax=Fertoeibacter niger TaxID=2656921 RepID=A0A8X8H340_9RHOB|nr:membrane protein insertion efficiency factor YidD [Fertoeibacter niger]